VSIEIGHILIDAVTGKVGTGITGQRLPVNRPHLSLPDRRYETQSYSFLCPVLKANLPAETGLGIATATNDVFDSPPDEKNSSKQNHDPIHKMDGNRRPRPNASLSFVDGPLVNCLVALFKHVFDCGQH
jgi:hypothetical protein